MATDEELEAEAIEPVYPEYYIIAAPRALRAIRMVADTIGARLRRWQDERLFRRPEAVPEDWGRSSTKGNRGAVYEKPGTKGTSYVKIHRAEPNSSNPGQRYDNVRWMRNGESLDVNGKIVNRNSLESHIPIKKFKFNPELFK